MADDIKVYRPDVIEDTPLPGEEPVVDQQSSGTSKNEFRPTTTPDRELPVRRIAVEVIGSALNTQSRRILGEFEFTQSGALQIGKYVNGRSGDLRISPSGIVARDSSGNNTFTLDGETGDATFKGTVQAGSFVAGIVTVGNNAVQIDGDADHPAIRFFADDGKVAIFIGDV